jgi:hypothetical protein
MAAEVARSHGLDTYGIEHGGKHLKIRLGDRTVTASYYAVRLQCHP